MEIWQEFMLELCSLVGGLDYSPVSRMFCMVWFASVDTTSFMFYEAFKGSACMLVSRMGGDML